ncbi:MAG: ROK family transcriptional regulator [Vallitaleaceae bacterium]|nr:ROK family transcriptional regulator [Vallitaleaceae bacterium]
MNQNYGVSGSNHQDTKIRNRSLVLKLICTTSNISRIDISKMTGLSKMSVTNIVNELISEGYVIEQIDPSSANEVVSSGRRPVNLSPTSNTFYSLGVYVSRDAAVCTISNLRCEILYENRCQFALEETNASFNEKIYDLLIALMNQSDIRLNQILGIGVACIGPLDVKNGIILNPPNFHNLVSIPIQTFLENAFHLKVFIENDMNASALAEKLFGKAKQIQNYVYIGVTNGIGSGVISNSALFKGDMGFGGEVGHITINFDGPRCPCGNIGCLELYASIPEIVKQARDSIALGVDSSLKLLETIQWRNIVEQAFKGDKLSQNLIERLCLYISIGLISIANIFDPEVIYLGHEISLAGELVRANLEEKINQRIFSSKYKRIPIEISEFIDRAPIAGSNALVLNQLFTNCVFTRQ